MTKIKYTGTSDFQEFGAKDFAKEGVEAKKISFAQGEPTEVDAEVAKVLTSKTGTFGDFSFEEVKDSEEQTDDGEADRSDSQDEASGEGVTPQTGVADAKAKASPAKKTTSSSTR